LGDGTEMLIWPLRASGLKKLTARLLVANGGKLVPANEVEYRWDKWQPADAAANGQLVLCIQSGEGFGVKGKRLPTMDLDLQGPASGSHKQSEPRHVLLEGDFRTAWGTTFLGSPLPRQYLLHSQGFFPANGTKTNAPTVRDRESLSALAKEGWPLVGVELEWAPP
jgi:hypothetical protein